MNDMAEDPTGETGAQVLAAVETSTGMEGLSMVASTAVDLVTTTTTDSENGATSANGTTSANVTTTEGSASASAPHIQVELVLVTTALSVVFASSRV